MPSTLSTDDTRLPAVDLVAAPLRLNSVALPAEAWGSGDPDRAPRIQAMRTWLLASCGDYNVALQRAVTRYLEAITTHAADNSDALATGLAPFLGLYRVEDWCWSALRPLPRAWWRQDGAWLHADLAFWDGSAVIAMTSRDFATGELPRPFQNFWKGQTLPVSPFRREFPTSPDGVSLRPSSPGHTAPR
ncbi:MAG: hypothetical protein EXR07_11265 [Acetobacteraceae bacterium]|nr:hypothetical protein [Acetobacteraceae bacterium]